jgi:hypothetical protein
MDILTVDSSFSNDKKKCCERCIRPGDINSNLSLLRPGSLLVLYEPGDLVNSTTYASSTPSLFGLQVEPLHPPFCTFRWCCASGSNVCMFEAWVHKGSNMQTFDPEAQHQRNVQNGGCSGSTCIRAGCIRAGWSPNFRIP